MISSSTSSKIHFCIICMHCLVLRAVEHRATCVCMFVTERSWNLSECMCVCVCGSVCEDVCVWAYVTSFHRILSLPITSFLISLKYFFYVTNLWTTWPLWSGFPPCICTSPSKWEFCSSSDQLGILPYAVLWDDIAQCKLIFWNYLIQGTGASDNNTSHYDSRSTIW